MKKNELDKDQGLRLAVQHKNEAAGRMMLSEDFTDRLMQRIEQQNGQPAGNEQQQPKYRRVWLYSVISAVAASIVLLIVMNLNQSTTGEQPTLIAQTDSTQTTTKKVEEEVPVQKEKETETTDTVKMIKKRYRAPRPPKHYMAKAETVVSPSEPETIDEEALAERAFAEEKMRMEMEMMSKMQGSLQANFKGLTDEIRSRGERMSQHVVMAMSNEE